jgi:hypothetical protein
MQQPGKYKPLLDPNPGAGGGGGGGSTWRDALPQDLRDDPILVGVKDLPDLAKGYANAQRMIGNRIAKPQPDWKPEQWNDFYNNIGRPAEHSKYKPLEYAFPEGFPQIDKTKMEGALKHFHGLGFTQQQLDGVLKFYYDDITGGHKAQQDARKQAHANVMAKLGERLGGPEKVGFTLERARNAIKKLAGEGEDFDNLVGYISDQGLDNNYEFLVMMSRIGEMMEEDRARGGSHSQGFSATAAQAASEIARLESDPEFQKALNDRYHPGHQEAINRNMQLYKTAYPGKQTE